MPLRTLFRKLVWTNSRFCPDFARGIEHAFHRNSWTFNVKTTGQNGQQVDLFLDKSRPISIKCPLLYRAPVHFLSTVRPCSLHPVAVPALVNYRGYCNLKATIKNDWSNSDARVHSVHVSRMCVCVFLTVTSHQFR